MHLNTVHKSVHVYFIRFGGMDKKLLRAVYTSLYVATEYEFLMILMYSTLPPR
jgi:hypothetical protein